MISPTPPVEPVTEEAAKLPPVDGYGARPEGHYSAESMRAYAATLTARLDAAERERDEAQHDAVAAETELRIVRSRASTAEAKEAVAREALKTAEGVIGNLQTLVVNVCGWVSRGRSEQAVNVMTSAMDDGWTEMGWKPYLDARTARRLKSGGD